MISTIRRPLRRTAAGMGLLALLLGTAACTGGEDEAPAGPAATTQQAPADEGASDEATPAPGEGGGEGSTSPFTDAELEAASERLVDIVGMIAEQDWEAACGAVLDPTTGTAPEGERLQECVDGVEPALADRADELPSGALDAIEPSMVRASDNGDGTVSLSVLDEELDIPMAPGDDDRWYLVIPF